MKITDSPHLGPRPARMRPGSAPDSCQLGSRDALQAAYERAVRRFGGIPGAEIQVTESAASGHKPVVVLRHAEGRREDYRLHVHFHGDQLYDLAVGYEQQLGASVERAWGKSKDTVFVLPEARNENQAPRSDWNNIANVDTLARDGVRALGLDPEQAGYRTVSGHSAGGAVIAKALARSSGQLRAWDRIELYDAAVSSQHNPVSAGERERVQRWCRQHPTQFVVMPGIMQSSWLTYVDKTRWTVKASDHWSPLWQSLGQSREPGPQVPTLLRG